MMYKDMDDYKNYLNRLDNARLILEWQRYTSKKYNPKFIKDFTEFVKCQKDLDPQILLSYIRSIELTMNQFMKEL